MKTTVTHNAVQIDGDPDGQPITVTDDIMRQISEQIGVRLLAGRMKGIWFVIAPDGGWTPRMAPHRRKFSTALSDALGLAVVCQVPLPNFAGLPSNEDDN